MEKIFSKFAAKYCEVKCISRNNFSMKVCFCSTFDNNIRNEFIYCLIELSFSLLKVENKKNKTKTSRFTIEKKKTLLTRKMPSSGFI